MHCEDPGCLKACPSPGAIVQYANGIVDFHEENCIGCGYCVTGCPFDIPRISKKDHKAYKCTLCSDRVAVGLEPACIKACPTGALVFGTKEDMQQHAAERVEDLKCARLRAGGALRSRRASAARTSCTCCTTPTSRSSTAACRKTRRSVPTVRLWKGFAKPLALALMAFAALAGFFHYIRVGPDETDERDEAARGRGQQRPEKPDERHTAVQRSGPMPAPAHTAPRLDRALRRRGTHQSLARGYRLRAGCAVGPGVVSSGTFLVLSDLFGGGPWTRILHPFLGLVMCCCLFSCGSRVARDNRMQPRDWQWLRQYRDVIENREERLPEVGRYNAGQKLVFYSVVACLTLLLLTGVIIWRVYTGGLFLRRRYPPGLSAARDRALVLIMYHHRARVCGDLG